MSETTREEREQCLNWLKTWPDDEFPATIAKRLCNQVDRLEAIESAARALIEYEISGAPDHPEWEALFDKLKAALAAKEDQ